LKTKEARVCIGEKEERYLKIEALSVSGHGAVTGHFLDGSWKVKDKQLSVGN
jgi:hypothetical protein